MTRIFATLHLTQMHSNITQQPDQSSSTILSMKLCLNQEIATGLILMLLNDENSVIRQHAIRFAQAYDQALQSDQSDEHLITCFSANKKIVSQAKRSADNFVPMKKPVTLALLKTLHKVRMELV